MRRKTCPTTLALQVARRAPPRGLPSLVATISEPRNLSHVKAEPGTYRHMCWQACGLGTGTGTSVSSPHGTWNLEP